MKAFIWDSSRLEYEAANDCELSISGEHFGRSGYAIGLRKGIVFYLQVAINLILMFMMMNTRLKHLLERQGYIDFIEYA